MNNITPYIYIFIFLGTIHTVLSQEKKSLIIVGNDANANIIIQEIGYEKRITEDSSFTDEITRFEKKLLQSGFIQYKVDSVHEIDSTYYLKIDLNESVKKIRLHHDDIQIFANQLKFDSENDTSLEIAFSKLASFMDRTINYYQDKGYPFVQVRLSDIKRADDLIAADVVIDKQERRTIDKIIIKGYTDFPKSHVRRQFGINLNDPFSKKEISQVSTHVKRIPFASQIKPPELLFTKDSTALYLYLKREKSNYFDGLIGFSTSLNNQKIQLYGNVDLKIQNSINQGESLQLNWLRSQNQSQDLNISLEAPYIFNTPLIAGYKFHIHKQDTIFLATSHLLKLDYQLATEHYIGFAVESENSNKTTDQILSNIDNFSSYFYGISYTFNKTYNHPIFNKKIYLSSIVSQGKREETSQNKITNHFQYLIPFSTNHNLLLKSSTEILISDDYLENELFRIGGSNSIRGFDENVLITDSYSYLNIGYNYLLNETSYMSALVDLGLLRNNIEDSLLRTYSFGIGFSQQTKIGQLGIQYFVGNTHKNSFSLSNSKLHVKITQPF